MKEVNEFWLQITSNNTLSAIDHEGQTFNSNIAKDQAQNEFFWPLDDIELVDWISTTKPARFWLVRIFTTHLFSNYQLKEQFRNLPIQIYQASCLKMIQTIKKSVCWVCVFAQKGHTVDIVPYSQLGCLPY